MSVSYLVCVGGIRGGRSSWATSARAPAGVRSQASYSVWRGSGAGDLRLVCGVVHVGGVVDAAPCRTRSVRVVPEEVHHVAVSVLDAVALLVAGWVTIKDKI